MVNIRALEDVLADLSSANLAALDEAILQSGMLLERERRLAWVDDVAQHPSRWPRRITQEDPEAHRQQIREAYTSILWPELIDGQLTRDQEDELVAALLGALIGERGGAASSLLSGNREGKV